MASRMRLLELSIPLRSAFTNAATSVESRRVVLVGMAGDDAVGWGEAAPYPGVTTEAVDDTWNALRHHADRGEEADVDHLPTTAVAALDQAASDLEARSAGVSMRSWLGGHLDPVPASAAIGIKTSFSATLSAVEHAVDAGFRAVKLKIAPGHDHEYVTAVRRAYPDLSLAADANGAYVLGDPFLDRLDDLGLDYIEQPLAAVRLDEHALLRNRFETAICLDESTHSTAGAERALARGAGDILALKPALLGVRGTADLVRRTVNHGLRVKIGGLLETSVGRAHALALASLPGVEFSDLAPARWFLDGDVVSDGWAVSNGQVVVDPGVGIGVDVDDLEIAGLLERDLEIAIHS